MREYDWLQYNLTWFEKDPSDSLVGEVALLWPSKCLLVSYGVIPSDANCIEGELPVSDEHLVWLASISPVAIDLSKYDYLVGLSGCWANS